MKYVILRLERRDSMKKKYSIIIGIILGIVGFIIGFTAAFNSPKEVIRNVELKTHKKQNYYIITGDYDGEYDYQSVNFTDRFEEEKIEENITTYNTTNILSYNEYSNFCKKWGLKKKYSDSNKQYMIISYAVYGQPIVKARVANVDTKKDNITIYLWENTGGLTADVAGYFIAIPIANNIKTNKIVMTHTKEEYKNIVKYGTSYDPKTVTVDKPIIYLYPEEETEVTVKLGHPELLTVSYPKYEQEWKVTATPNGIIKENKKNREYYGLYYESSNHVTSIQKDGFIVKKEEIISFLEEKLQILGLNEREANEFIIYWLPILENSPYNYIRFETKEEMNQYMPLEINPKPDTIIRVLMDYKPLEKEIKVTEQNLTNVERKGFTVVEWGGSEIKR